MAPHFIVQALDHKVMRSIPGLPEQYENNEGMDPLPDPATEIRSELTRTHLLTAITLLAAYSNQID